MGVAVESLAPGNGADVATMPMGMWLWRHGAPAGVITKMFAPASGVYCLTADDLEAWKVTP
jgi:hypothetical protein